MKCAVLKCANEIPDYLGHFLLVSSCFIEIKNVTLCSSYVDNLKAVYAPNYDIYNETVK